MTGATTSVAERCDRLRALHHADRPLVLPNAWDAATARLFADAGFEAIATSSAAVAEAIGFADHEAAPAPQMLDAVARIARAVDVPVSADVEAGYGLEPETLVEGLLVSGAAGLNLEDTDHRAGVLKPVDAQAERLAAVKAAGRAAGADLVLNARVDVFIQALGTPEEQLAAALERGRAYLDAGADCVYPILVTDAAVIAALAEGLDGRINVLARPGAPSLERLAALGVARVTFGPVLYRVGLKAALEAAQRYVDGSAT